MNGTKSTIAILLAVLFLVCIRPPAHADERILRYDSSIVVRMDGSLRVTEVITVRSEGDRIKRHIPRFSDPVSRSGIQLPVPFTVVEVLRNGRPEAYHRGHRRARLYRRESDLSRARFVYLLPDLRLTSLGFFEGILSFTERKRQLLGVPHRLRSAEARFAARRQRQRHFIRGLYGF